MECMTQTEVDFSFCLLFLGIRHCDEGDTTARRSSGWIGVRGCRTAYYSSNSTTPPTSPLFSLHFFTFLLSSRWTRLSLLKTMVHSSHTGLFLGVLHLLLGLLLVEVCFLDQEDLLLLLWVQCSCLLYYSQGSGRHEWHSSKGGS